MTTMMVMMMMIMMMIQIVNLGNDNENDDDNEGTDRGGVDDYTFADGGDDDYNADNESIVKNWLM